MSGSAVRGKAHTTANVWSSFVIRKHSVTPINSNTSSEQISPNVPVEWLRPASSSPFPREQTHLSGTEEGPMGQQEGLFYSFSGCPGCTFESSRAFLVSQFFRLAQFAKPHQLFLLIFVTALCSKVGRCSYPAVVYGAAEDGRSEGSCPRSPSGSTERLTPSADLLLCFPVPLHEHSWCSNIWRTWIDYPTGVCEEYTGAPSEDSSGCRGYPSLWIPQPLDVWNFFVPPLHPLTTQWNLESNPGPHLSIYSCRRDPQTILICASDAAT